MPTYLDKWGEGMYMYVRTYSETYIGIKWNEKERKKWAYLFNFSPVKIFYFIY